MDKQIRDSILDGMDTVYEQTIREINKISNKEIRIEELLKVQFQIQTTTLFTLGKRRNNLVSII